MTNWIITSSALILIMIAARKLLKGHISPLLQYGLWLIVLVRLIIPFNPFESSFSVLNAVPQTLTAPEAAIGHTENTETEATLTLPTTVPTEGTAETTAETTEAALSDAPETTTPVPAQSALPSLSFVLGTLWLTGIAGILIYAAIRNTRLARFLKRTRKPFIDGTYIAAALPSSCLFGIVKPSIYITEAVAYDPLALEHVLAHEQAHRRHGDHIWNLLRIGVLALHWYNPLVWWACALSKRDAEMAADASAIAALAPGERFNYGETLLNMLDCTATRDTWFSCSTTMITTKRALRERIEAIVKNARTAVSMAAVVLLTAIAVVGCTFTGASSDANDTHTDQRQLDINHFIPVGREKIDAIAHWAEVDHGYTHTDVSKTLGEWISNSDIMKDMPVTDYYMLELSEDSLLGVIFYTPDDSFQQHVPILQFLREIAASSNNIPTFLGGGTGMYHFAIDAQITDKYSQYAEDYPYRYLIETNPWILDPTYAQPILEYNPSEHYSTKTIMDFYVNCAAESFDITSEDATNQLLQWIHDTGYERDDLIDTYQMIKLSDGCYVGSIVYDPSSSPAIIKFLYHENLKEIGLQGYTSHSISTSQFMEYLFVLYPADMQPEDASLICTETVVGAIIWADKRGLYE